MAGDWARYDRTAWAVFAQNRYLTPQVRSLIDFLSESFIDFLSESFIPRPAQSQHRFVVKDAVKYRGRPGSDRLHADADAQAPKKRTRK